MACENGSEVSSLHMLVLLPASASLFLGPIKETGSFLNAVCNRESL